jgi:TfoX/Sxy family transcriptional regulator of competence genes
LVPIGLLKKNASTKHNKYVVNKKIANFDDISYRELFGRIKVGFFLTTNEFVDIVFDEVNKKRRYLI